MQPVSLVNFRALNQQNDANPRKYTTSECQTLLKDCIAQEDTLILTYKKHIAQGDIESAQATKEKLTKVINRQNRISQYILRTLNYPTYGMKTNETDKSNIEIIG